MSAAVGGSGTGSGTWKSGGMVPTSYSGGVIVWHKNAKGGIEVLIGQEGSFFEDLKTTFDISTPIAIEYKASTEAAAATAGKPKPNPRKPANGGKDPVSNTYVAGWDLIGKGHAAHQVDTSASAWAEFSARAAQIETQAPKHPVHFSQVEMVKKAGKDYFETNFSYRGTGSYGIVKGGCKSGEISDVCAFRELMEELNDFRLLKSEKINFLTNFQILFKSDLKHCDIYTLELSTTRSAELEAHIAAMYAANYGEMYDLQFRPLADVLSEIASKSHRHYNQLSQNALLALNMKMTTGTKPVSPTRALKKPRRSRRNTRRS